MVLSLLLGGGKSEENIRKAGWDEVLETSSKISQL